ncbi:LysR family transcriptional regulator [Fusobacterium nucleatum]|uniref:Transcriptional regulator n=1 Tax=Fusobacterium nucleatum subsp. polymorphum TaxID=76857 RepID=A0A2C6A7C3_FUSNP|nr:LysR family transcriptional regulator [Fusobacterium polymorphum]PHH97948.1 transcriptional regulator [Fusobacterium polymorphum]
MDLKQLEYIVGIAEEKNITKAAKKLYITQSALNQTLLKLEKEIGEPLFERSKLNLYLTEIGKIYVEQAKKILEIRKETYEKIDEIKGDYNSVIRIGLTPERGMLMFLNIYPIFHEIYPNIKIEALELSVEEQHKMIEERKLDIGFVNVAESQKKSNIYQEIRKEKLVLAIPNKIFKNLKSKNIQDILNEIVKEDFVMLPQNTTIRKVIDEYLKKNQLFPKILFESKNSSLLIKMVESQLVCTIVSEIHAVKSYDIEYILLDNFPHLDYSVMFKKDKFLTTPVKKFINLAKEYWTLK